MRRAESKTPTEPRTLGEVFQRLASGEPTCDRFNADGSCCWESATEVVPGHGSGHFCEHHAAEERAK